ncbi:MAG: hypothetical protein E6K13_09585 [Methanobacteriota archaeon]|nr:MAG: hypothetical protein E6K13_09585 [Euryarchaeota archaeon]
MPARHRHPIYSARSRELAGGLLGVVAPATIIGGVHASVLLASSEWLAILALAITGVAVAFVVYNLSHFRESPEKRKSKARGIESRRSTQRTST